MIPPGPGFGGGRLGFDNPTPSPAASAGASCPAAVAQGPGGDHSHCSMWKRSSREVLTCFCCYRLKTHLVSGKSSQHHMTGHFLVCNHQVPHDAICKYLFWIIFLCPTELFSARRSSGGSSRSLHAARMVVSAAAPWAQLRKEGILRWYPPQSEHFWIFTASWAFLAHSLQCWEGGGMAYWDVGPDGEFGTSGCYVEYDCATRGPCLTTVGPGAGTVLSTRRYHSPGSGLAAWPGPGMWDISLLTLTGSERPGVFGWV